MNFLHSAAPMSYKLKSFQLKDLTHSFNLVTLHSNLIMALLCIFLLLF